MNVTVRLFGVAIPEVSPLVELGDLTARIAGKNYFATFPFDVLLPTLTTEDLEKFGYWNAVVFGCDWKFITFRLGEGQIKNEQVLVTGEGDHRSLLDQFNVERKAAYEPEIRDFEVGGGMLRAGVELGARSRGSDRFERVLVLNDWSASFGCATLCRQAQKIIASQMLYRVYVDHDVYT